MIINHLVILIGLTPMTRNLMCFKKCHSYGVQKHNVDCIFFTDMSCLMALNTLQMPLGMTYR